MNPIRSRAPILAACASAPLLCAAPALAEEPRPIQVQGGCTGGHLEVVHRFEGDEVGDYYGYAVSGGGDVDGDGVPDLLVSSPRFGGGSNPRFGLVLVHSGATGDVLLRIEGEERNVSMGFDVAWLGDVDGDGLDDLVVGVPGASPDGKPAAGLARVHSGATGDVIHEVHGPKPGDAFGHAVAGGGDVDGDGVPDFVVASAVTGVHGRDVVGIVVVYSGASGAPIHQWVGTQEREGFGHSIAVAGDVDRDGHADVIVGTSGTDVGGVLNAGAAYVFSGATGALLHFIAGPQGGAFYGEAVAGAGDVDGDGSDDFIVGAERMEVDRALSAGAAFVYSGRTGRLLHELQIGISWAWFGYSVAGLGDVDGDGLSDVAVGAPRLQTPNHELEGAVFVYSGTTGRLIREIRGTDYFGDFGQVVSGPGDVDGDGLGDVLVGAPYAWMDGETAVGVALVFSMRPLLQADARALSVSTGGRVRFGLHFPPSQAGQRYALRGSMTGRGPWEVGNGCVPLTPDKLTWHMATGNAPWFTNTDGVLDAQGRATVTLDVPPNSPAMARLVGTTLWFAAYTTDGQGDVREVSVAVSLDVMM